MYKCKRYQNQQGRIQDLSEGVRRFIWEQYYQDLGTKRRTPGEIFFCFALGFLSLSAIDKLFWNLRGVQRSCRPPPVSASENQREMTSNLEIIDNS